MLTVPLRAWILALAVLYARYAGNPQAGRALRGMGAVAGGLIAATGIKLIPALRRHPLGFGVCLGLWLLVFAAIALRTCSLGLGAAVSAGRACAARG